MIKLGVEKHVKIMDAFCPVFSPYTVVSVGFEYESCLNVILWEKRTATLQGYELEAANMGGWTLHKHHILDVPNGRNRLLNPIGTTSWEMSPHQLRGQCLYLDSLS